MVSLLLHFSYNAQLVAAFKLRLCRSMLRANPLEVSFDGCVVGATYHAEVTVTNACEVMIYLNFFKLCIAYFISEESFDGCVRRHCD